MATKKPYPGTKPASRASGSWVRRKRAFLFIAGLVGGFSLAGFGSAIGAMATGVSARIATAIGGAAATVGMSTSVAGAFGPRVGGAFTAGAFTGQLLNALIRPRIAAEVSSVSARPGAALTGAGTSAGALAPGTSYVSSTVQAFGQQPGVLVGVQQSLQQYSVWPGMSPDLVKDLVPLLPLLFP